MMNALYFKQLREAHELSQRALAKELGTTQDQIYQWETGKAQPSLPNFIKICEFFKAHPNTLIQWN